MENKEKVCNDIFDELILKSGMIASKYKFKQEIPKRPNPLKLSKWISNEIGEVERQIDSLEKDFNVQCTCTKGCAACCKQLIALSMSECLAMKPYIENLSTDERNNLKIKVIDQCEVLITNNITNREVNNRSNEKELQCKYFNLDLSCVFLDKEKSCVIHNIRPSLCWSYRNYGDKSECNKNFDVKSTIKYGDWEHRVFERILIARPIRDGLHILPFAIRKMMEW